LPVWQELAEHNKYDRIDNSVKGFERICMAHIVLFYFPFLNYDNPKTGGEMLNAEIISEVKGRSDCVILTPSIPDKYRNAVTVRIYSWFALCVALLKYRPCSIVADEYYHSFSFPLFYLARLGGIRTFEILHHLGYKTRTNHFLRGAESITEKSMLRSAERVFVISNAEASQALTCGIDKRCIFKLSPTYSLPEERRKSKPENASIRLLFVGTLYERKGLEYLIEALALLKATNWTISLAGSANMESPYVKNIMNMLNEHPNKNKIRILGRVGADKLESLYRSSDIFVLPSLYEGFGLVALEALGYGLPIVASDVGGIPEIVENGRSGLLVPASDSKALAAALDRLIIDRNLRNLFARNALARAKDFANKPSFAKQVCSFVFPRTGNER